MISVIQCNLGRGLAAQHEVIEYFKSSAFNVLLLQEPYHGSSLSVQCVYDFDVFQFPTASRHVKACVIVKKDVGCCIGWTEHSSPNVAIVQLQLSQRKLYLTSAYVEPDVDVSNTFDNIDSFLKSQPDALHVVGIDVNGRHMLWGCDDQDARGETLANIAASNQLNVCNVGRQATFETITHGRHFSSIIDVTLTSEHAADAITDWKVATDVCQASDHNAITFKVQNARTQRQRDRTSTYLFNNKTADWGKFDKSLTSAFASSSLLSQDVTTLSAADVDLFVVKLTDVIRQACFSSMKIGGEGRPVNPWWTPELEALKKTSIRLHHRLSQLSRSGASTDVAAAEHQAAKTKYAKAIKKTSGKNFREFCQRQGKEDVWSLTNRLIKDAPRRQPPATLRTASGVTSTSEETASSLLHHFYPDDTADVSHDQHQLRKKTQVLSDADDEPPFTSEEVAECLKTMNPNRAPGHDALTSDICTAVIIKYPDVMTSLFNRCLELGHFPTSWKEARVRIIQKPGKDDYTSLTSFRPIGLLPVFGKLLQKLFIKRLTFDAQTSKRWSDRQFGFREQTSTSHALRTLINRIKSGRQRGRQVVGVSLDIKAAFDNAWWPALMERLRKTSCPRNVNRLIVSYLQDRTVSLDFADARSSKTMTKGCIQGSVCGPTFWNLILDELLDVTLPPGCHIQAYADDVMLLVERTSATDVETTVNSALDRILRWGESVKLTFSSAKTQAIAFTQKAKSASIVMNGQNVYFTPTIKLLGVIIDTNLSFVKHVRHVIAKVTSTFKLLCKFIRPTWGVHSENAAIIYRHVIEPTITYTAGIWGDAVKYECVRRQLRTFQRSFAIRVIRGFHTVSATSASAIAGFTPLHLKITEAFRIDKVKTDGTFDDLPEDVTLERLVKPEELLHPAERLNVKAKTAQTEQDVERHSSVTNIYTDGSKLETGDVGSAFVIMHPDGRQEKHKFKLHTTCSVFQAELFALEKAVTWIDDSATSDVTIFCDSQSSLKALEDRSCKLPLVVSIHKMLRQMTSTDVTFVWIKAHIGLAGNEAADVAAKEAASEDSASSYASFPISYAKYVIRQQTSEAWQQEYETSETGSTTRTLFPTLTSIRRFFATAETSFGMTQFVSGHGFYKSYLKRFHITSDSTCPCGADVQDVAHLLTSCPFYAALAADFAAKCDEKNVSVLDFAAIAKHQSIVKSLEILVSRIVKTLKSLNTT